MLAAITQPLPRTICDSDLLSRHATQLATPKIMVIAKKAKYRVIASSGVSGRDKLCRTAVPGQICATSVKRNAPDRKRKQ